MSRREDTASDTRSVPPPLLRTREEPAQFRPLAPRAPPPQSAYDPALLAYRHRQGLTFDGRCDVCFSRTCGLQSHRLYTQSRRGVLLNTRQSNLLMRSDTFSLSYVTTICTWFTDQQLPVALWDYNLPLGEQVNQNDMRRLFQNWFAVQATNFLTIPRPMEVVNELLHGPFLLPALNDGLLCYSILAVSATMQMDLPESSRRVLALTLFDRAMSLLRRRVAPNSLQLDSNVVAAATYLLHANLSLADENSLEAQARSIESLMDAQGGVGNLGMEGAVANLLRWTDILYSVRMPQTPCRYLLAEDIMDFDEIGSQHGAFWKNVASITPIFDERVVQACQDCNQMIAFVDTNEAATTEPVAYFYLYQKVFQLFQRTSVTRAQYFRSRTIEECLMLTINLLIVLIFMGGWENPNRSDVKKLCSCIVEAVRHTASPDFWRSNVELFIWMMFVVRVAEHQSIAQDWAKRVLRSALESKLGSQQNWTTETQQSLTAMLVSFGWSEIALLSSIEGIYVRLYE